MICVSYAIVWLAILRLDKRLERLEPDTGPELPPAFVLRRRARPRPRRERREWVDRDWTAAS